MKAEKPGGHQHDQANITCPLVGGAERTRASMFPSATCAQSLVMRKHCMDPKGGLSHRTQRLSRMQVTVSPRQRTSKETRQTVRSLKGMFCIAPKCCIRVDFSHLEGCIMVIRLPWVVLVVKNLPANTGDIRDMVPSLVWKDPLEEGVKTHISTLAWRIPWTEEPGGLESKTAFL